MTTESLAGCVLSLSANDLSAWRDGAMDDAKKARLDMHIPGCDACSARIGAYEDIARALRAIPTPEPLHSYGRNPRTHGTSAERRAPIWQRREFSGLGAVAAIALLLLAFAQVFGRLGAVQSPTVTATQSPTPMATTTATATAMPVPRLAFRPITLPPGFPVPGGSIAVSPVDGKDAWACEAAGTGAFQIWATTDEGSTWHAAGLLHLVTPMQPGPCGMLADQHDTQAAVFGVKWGGDAGDLAGMSFYTRDGGAHWQQLPGWTITTSVDTDGAHTYAAVNVITPPSTQQQPPPAALLAGASPPRFSAPGLGTGEQFHWELVVSSDGLHTWRELHPGGLAPAGGPGFQFWYGPTSGELFAAAYNDTFWQSLDGGVSWTLVRTSNPPVILGRWLASRKAWMFCEDQGFASPPSMQCSTDTGKTWQTVPALTYTEQCVGRCSSMDRQVPTLYSPAIPCPPLAVASDGALVTTCPADGAAADHIIVYRLAPGAATWVALGSVASAPPTGACQISADNTMWCLNTGGSEWETVTLPS